MEKTFETEVLTRLAVIESKLDGYQNIKEMQDNNKWLFRTAVGACITSVISLIAMLVKVGIGVG